MRGLKTCVFFVFYLGTFAATGCGERDFSKPPKILYGRDVCAQCRMIVQDERFACAVVSVEQRYLKFDDIGCLAKYEKEQMAQGLRAWVHDATTSDWVLKGEAHFVYSQDLVTPMGYGLAAFASAKEAEKFVEENGGHAVSRDELLIMEEIK